MNAEDLKQRCAKFIADHHLQTTKFVKNIGISLTGYYRWQKGEIDYSLKMLTHIDSYLRQYGY